MTKKQAVELYATIKDFRSGAIIKTQNIIS